MLEALRAGFDNYAKKYSVTIKISINQGKLKTIFFGYFDHLIHYS